MRSAPARAILLAAALAMSAAAQEQNPAETPAETQADTPGETQPETSENAQNDTSADTETDTPAETDAQADAPADSPTDAPAAAADAGDEAVPYTVDCWPDPEAGGTVCQVDRATYVGWRTFHSVCHTCHAQDAVGSTFAPDLLPRIRQIDKERFVQVVDQGFTGQVGVMPGWGMNPNVNRFYDELWAYLRARADGALRPGRPKRLPDE